MLIPRAVVIVAALLPSLGGCATVAVYDTPTSAEFAILEQQSELHKASDAYCDAARKKGLATGEANIGSLAGILAGKDDSSTYWRKIGADRATPTIVLNRVRADMGETAGGLSSLSSLAQKLLASATPSREDVTQFERALIHARQARDSLSDAIQVANKRASREVQTADELKPLDAALAKARATADDLAAARMSSEIAENAATPVS